jgi:type II secretory pathway predicted ATPase ExeA
MYEAYWKLTHKPFENAGDARTYYPGESHQAGLLKLRYAIENQRGGALLTGGSGTGKTLLVRMLAAQLPETCSPVVHLVFPQMSPADLLAYLAAELGAKAEVGAVPRVEESVRRIQTTLTENAAKGRHAVLVIDEAHLLEGHRTFEALRLLMNFEVNAQPVLTLLLIGQPSLLPLLARMPALEERLAVKCLLRPLTLEETMAYVQHRLSAAGRSQPVFETSALETLFYLTQGNPRRINRLCDLALLIGYAEEQALIGSAHLESVAQELTTVAVD